MPGRECKTLAGTLLFALASLWPAAGPALAQDDGARWDSMTPEQRDAWQQRRAAWDALPLVEREDRRSRYAAWRELDDVQRARLRAAAEGYALLPAEEQAALRARFDALDDMQQRGWRLGPALGADYPRLQPLFAYLPQDQRGAMLLFLRQLDAEQRDDLAALAQRIPPQQRDAFRRELLAVPADQRGAWLRQRRDQ
ncbi:DUF3106 domain-containing protein [Pseudoxanthomonas putridarboris]|uniref:DUF3106 domain-containing protein n=1 Tax=Pseudoxanthomonas putridarboris TaxID=752605 RepID=A0ABU9IX82_9GAMM